MNNDNVSREMISAFADSEFTDAEIATVMAALRRPGGKQDWELYHQVGDVLRSNDMAFNMSPRFYARMSAALEREPVIVAPSPQTSNEVVQRQGNRWAIPGMAAAAAAVAAVAFVATPQLMLAVKGASQPKATISSGAALASAAASSVAPAVVKTVATQGRGVVLRDERIDDYLLAHQQFSPSLYSTAQYARSATFANDSGK
jgi:sigma-E factor negative regulatory protein RseA